MNEKQIIRFNNIVENHKYEIWTLISLKKTINRLLPSNISLKVGNISEHLKNQKVFLVFRNTHCGIKH